MSMLYRPLYWYGNNYRPTDRLRLFDRPGAARSRTTTRTVTIKLNPYEVVQRRARDLAGRRCSGSTCTRPIRPRSTAAMCPGVLPGQRDELLAPNPRRWCCISTSRTTRRGSLTTSSSQITPLPLAWDRTSLSQPAPKSDNGHLPDAPRPARSPFTSSWTRSPRSSDRGRRLPCGASSTARSSSRASHDRQVTLVPNPDYSGSPKPTISKFVELPFTSETAIYNEIRSGGPGALTVAEPARAIRAAELVRSRAGIRR